MKRPEKLGRYNGGLQEFIVPDNAMGRWTSTNPRCYLPLDQAKYFVVYLRPKGV
jgi:hypothetical protein